MEGDPMEDKDIFVSAAEESTSNANINGSSLVSQGTTRTESRKLRGLHKNLSPLQQRQKKENHVSRIASERGAVSSGIPLTSQGGLRRHRKAGDSDNEDHQSLVPRTTPPIVKGGLRRRTELQAHRRTRSQDQEEKDDEEDETSSLSQRADQVPSGQEEQEDLESGEDDSQRESLVEATPIFSNLMEADPVDVESQRAQKLQRQKRLTVRYAKTVFAMFLVLIVVVAAVVLGVVFSRDDNKVSYSEDTQASTSSSHASSTQVPAEAGNPSNASSTQVPAEAGNPLDALHQKLPDYTLARLQNTTSPQFKAFDWLLHHPNVSNLEEWRKQQVFAMVTYYFSFEGTFWSETLFKHNWLNQSKPECEWYPDFTSGDGAAFCDYGSSEDDVLITEFRNPAFDVLPICNDLGQLTLLHLHYGISLFGYSPTLPPEISLLPSLNTIYLYGNDISMPLADMIPSQMGLLSNLTTLRLDHNYLYGTIPSEIGLVTSLEELDLAENRCTGSIPTQLGRVTSMETLHMYTNYFEGGIPSEVGAMQSLQRLSVRDNSLSKAIPSELGQLAHAEDMILYNNALEQLPSELGTMKSLKNFLAGNNSLRETIPSELGLWPQIRVFHLHRNALVGTLPTEVAKLTTLFMLSVRENRLTGAIPSELGLLNTTGSLFLGSNAFNGTIPSTLGLSRFSYLYLDDNQLTGTIPAELDVSNWIFLHNNLLTSTIPRDLTSSFDGFSCPSHRLSLSNNMLTGSIPSETGMSTGLHFLLLDNNLLSNLFPPQLFNLSELQVLSLSSNLVSPGRIPSEIGLLGSLAELHLDNNLGLIGTLPQGMDSLVSKSLGYVDIRGTRLVGTLSDTMCQLQKPSCFYKKYFSTLNCSLKFDCSAALCGCDGCLCPSNYTSEGNITNNSNSTVAETGQDNIFMHKQEGSSPGPIRHSSKI